MPSTLGNSILDSLLPTVDSLRGSLLPIFGIRQFRVFIVTRTFSGTRRGDGPYVDSRLELLPQPKVQFTDRSYALLPTGRHDEARCVLTELSLALYNETDLTGGDVPANVQFFYTLEEGQGQGLRVRAYHTDGVPEPDRDETIGWKVYLKRADGVLP